MLFSSSKSAPPPSPGSGPDSPSISLENRPNILYIGDADSEEFAALSAKLADGGLSAAAFPALPAGQKLTGVTGVVVSRPATAQLEAALQAVRAERNLRAASAADGYPVLIAVFSPGALLELGVWLMQHAAAQDLDGFRVVVAHPTCELAQEISQRLVPVFGPSVIAMPSAPEIENSPMNYFFAISPEMQQTVRTIGELAENKIERVYLLGGPGAGKTSLAYYYWLKRGEGRFIAVNLSAESTGDKEAMKSLLCGHVAGSFPGASSREGAFSFSEGGVTFLDESHGATGTVMQVLMEALDSGQYLPFGATKKRLLTCAVVFASNRSWEQLREEINLDEHARLGATIVPVFDLSSRPEDLAVGTAIALARFKSKCRTWNCPDGLSEDAWQVLSECLWRGNMRTLFRVMETALVSQCTTDRKVAESGLLSAEFVQQGVALWEPAEHHSLGMYTSYR